MNAHFLENLHDAKWTAPIGWPCAIVRDRNGGGPTLYTLSLATWEEGTCEQY